MKEYSIYCCIRKGKPFFVDTNTNISVIKEKLYEITSYIDDLNITYFAQNQSFRAFSIKKPFKFFLKIH